MRKPWTFPACPPSPSNTLLRGVLDLKESHVVVRRDRPTALAVSIALMVTMLVVYVLTLEAARPDAVERVSAAPRVTREIEFAALEGWCVSLGRWDSADQARAEAARFTGRGAAGCVCAIDGRWHVLGTMYDSRRQAERVAETVGEDIPAEVVALTAKAVKMRITAPDRQIDLIVAADGLLRDQVWQLMSVAQQLDRGEIQPEAALTLCALSASEGKALGEKLGFIPGAEDNALCAALIDALNRAAARLEDVRAGNQGGAALSGLIRQAGIEGFMRLRELQAGLTK